MAIDRIDWHSGGEYPANLPYENGGTHIGMYIAWIINNDLYGEIHRGPEALPYVSKVKNREWTGLDFLLNRCDGKFWNEDLNEEGLAFTNYYYALDGTGLFYEDYMETLAVDMESIYRVENSWENYDKLEKLISNCYNSWKSK